jgi:hypothetical protein
MGALLLEHSCSKVLAYTNKEKKEGVTFENM